MSTTGTAYASLYVHVRAETTIRAEEHPVERRAVLRVGDSPAEVALFLDADALTRLIAAATAALDRLTVTPAA